MTSDIDKRLQQIEVRLARLEARDNRPTEPQAEPPGAEPEATAPLPEPVTVAYQPQSTRAPIPDATAKAGIIKTEWSMAKVLGWAGATALVIAAAYLVRLAWSGGWLTPVRQITFAVLAGLCLIAAGMRLKNSDREYSSLLPAGGIVVLFLAIYGAHLYHELINVQLAWIMIAAICVASLALCRFFNSQIYSLFAVIGSYSAPFLLSDATGSLTDLIVYYSAWSVIFSAFAIWLKDRRVYLLALYLALIGFDVIWRMLAPTAWLEVVIFQFVQLIIFTTCAVYYSARHNAPMSRETALAHGPALLIFYALEYAVLDANIPGLAPWVAVTSAAVLLAGYRIAKVFLDDSLASSQWLLAAYCGLVLLHAGYLESVPGGFKPWVAMLLAFGSAGYLYWRKATGLLAGPIGWVIGLIFAANYLRLVAIIAVDEVPAANLLLTIFAAQLYAAYYFYRRTQLPSEWAPIIIYAAHIALMVAVLQIFDNRYLVNVLWAGIALASILYAKRTADDTLKFSALPVLAVTAVLGYITGASEPDSNIGALNKLLMVIYALQLYGAYYLIRKEATLLRFAPVMVNGAHLATMLTVVVLLDNRFAISITWAALALGSLLLALRQNDKVLGQSSLLIFGISVIKVFIFDIAAATPIVRILCLVALGLSLYAGGWLYKKVDQLEAQ